MTFSRLSSFRANACVIVIVIIVFLSRLPVLCIYPKHVT